jgi:hypothetical protein
MKVIAYTYDADIHCVDCTLKRFTLLQLANPDTRDSEGNPLHVICSYEALPSTYCSDCQEKIY